MTSPDTRTRRVAGTAGLLLEGLTISMSGGDGVYISHAPPCDKPPHCVYTPATPERIPRDIVLRSVSSLYNYRHGMSIIAVDGLLADDCDFSMTGRWPPWLQLVNRTGLGAPHTAPAAGVSTATAGSLPGVPNPNTSNGPVACRSISSLTIQRTWSGTSVSSVRGSTTTGAPASTFPLREAASRQCRSAWRPA